jgi:Uncharacterized protein conserved in bacteria (DUF2255)
MGVWIRVSTGILLALAASACFNPSERRPGTRLSGEAVASLPSDWSFTNAQHEIAIEVRTPYWLPHSVTIWCASDAGALYVAARDPDDKRWPGWVADDPDVRLLIAGKIYEVKLARLDDPEQIARVRRAYAAKYQLPDTPPGEGPPVRYWRVVPRG